MRPIRIGLAVALALAALAPVAVMSAPKDKAAAAALKAIEKGKAEVPPLLIATGVTCTMADARWMGEDKNQRIIFYEVACQQGMGFVLMNKLPDPKAEPGTEAPKPTAFTCLEAMRPQPDGTPSSLACELPGNADPKSSLKPFIAKAGVNCEMDKARGIGSGSKSSYFEVSCAGGSGYILVTSAPPNVEQAVQMNSCLAYDPEGNINCQLTTREQQLAVVDALAAKAGRQCQVKDRRYVLSAKDGNYYEIACADGKGYMLLEDLKGGLQRVIDCPNADYIGGGCTLTDSRSAQTEQAQLYTRLSAKAGFPCQVTKYAPFPTSGPKEVVELQCSDRPDGGVAIFTASGPGKVYDCVRSELEGFRCSFTKKEVVYPKLTTNLKALGKNDCTVSDARVVGRATEEDFVEVACSDGLPGWVIGYTIGSTSPKEVMSCVQAANIGSGCKLPTNGRRR